MIPRDGAVAALGRFLTRHAQDGKINGMTIDTIMKMARLVLNTNCFAFENKYYQQIRGGGMGSPLRMILANIYMFEWEQPLIEHQILHKELYGRYVLSSLFFCVSYDKYRYIDDVFMTTNSWNQLNILLNRMEKKDENIRITRSMGSTIAFLDVLISNDHGQLKTSVFHKPAVEPYLLPYSSEHPRHTHCNTIKGALLRAIRLCSQVEDFDQDRLQIELKLLLNGYPLKFVTKQFQRFFVEHNASMLILEQPNEMIYPALHSKLLAQVSRRQKQCVELIANDNSLLQQQQRDRSKLTVHFTFDSGAMLKFKQELRRLWENYYTYPGSPMNNVRLQIGTWSNKSRCQLLVKKKPPKNLLVDPAL